MEVEIGFITPTTLPLTTPEPRSFPKLDSSECMLAKSFFVHRKRLSSLKSEQFYLLPTACAQLPRRDELIISRLPVHHMQSSGILTAWSTRRSPCNQSEAVGTVSVATQHDSMHTLILGQ